MFGLKRIARLVGVLLDQQETLEHHQRTLVRHQHDNHLSLTETLEVIMSQNDETKAALDTALDTLEAQSKVLRDVADALKALAANPPADPIDLAAELQRIADLTAAEKATADADAPTPPPTV